MTIDGTDLFIAAASAVVSGVLGAAGWWVRTLVKRIDDVDRELGARIDKVNERCVATDAALHSHKLWAAENYVKADSLKQLRDDLIAHFDRLERNVRDAMTGRHAGNPGE